MTDNPRDRQLALLKRLCWQYHSAAEHLIATAKLSPGGDEVTLGSTNDLDDLREANQEFIDHWHEDASLVPIEEEYDP